VVQQLKQQGIPVTVVYDAESGEYPLYRKIKLEVPHEADVIIYLPRHHEDGSVPREFTAERYQTRTNVSFSTANELTIIIAALLNQTH
jgi:hypothetical protein